MKPNTIRILAIGLTALTLTSAQAANDHPWPGPLPDDDPASLLTAFVQADAWGMQTGGQWSLVERFTTWEDGPGWDTASVIESAQIVSRREVGDETRITVRFRKIGNLGTDGYGKPTFDRSTAGIENTTFILKNGSATNLQPAGHWKIIGPQDGPRISVGYALKVMVPKWCEKLDCRKNEAVRLLNRRQAACAPSPIVINRACGARSRSERKR